MKRSLTRLLAVLLCLLLGVSALLFAACSDGGTQDDGTNTEQPDGTDPDDSDPDDTGDTDPDDAKPAAGTPYNADGAYDVTVPHVLVNQVFGASDDAEVVSHSFIELYNPTEEAVSLDGWALYYKSSADGKQSDAWLSLTLQGEIAAEGYFLIRCGQVDTIASGAYR